MGETYSETVHFSGHVQGVGFRYTTLQVAKEFEIAGQVLNLADGRVCLQAEGKESEVKAFVEAVQERLHGYIRKCERKEQRGPRRWSGFVIGSES